MAKIVYTNVSGEIQNGNGLFQGTSFWLSHRVPQRKRFIDEVLVCLFDIPVKLVH